MKSEKSEEGPEKSDEWVVSPIGRDQRNNFLASFLIIFSHISIHLPEGLSH